MAGVVVLPETVFKKIYAKIKPHWKACFWAALLAGVLAHFYKITNWLPNWDSLVFRYDGQNMIGLGRWFLPVVCAFSSFYDLPFLNGVIAIVFHALGAVCICEIASVQRKMTAAFIGAVIVSFPTVTSIMMYNYVADGYSIAFFLSSLAALCMTRENPRYLLSAILIALSAGIYQAYITVTIMLVLLKLINDIVFGSASVGTVLKKTVPMLLTGVFGMAVYSIILKILLRAFSIELLEYQGVNTAISLSNIDLRTSLYVIKDTFFKCFFDFSGGINLYIVLNSFILAVTITYYLVHIIKNQLHKSIANLIIPVLLSVMLVVGAGVLAFINASVDYHNLMRMGYAVFYLFFLLIYEKGTETCPKHTAHKRWIVLLTAITLFANQVVIANVSYHKAQMAYEKSYGVLIRIADRIEQTPGTENCDRILVLGALDNSEAYSVNLPPDITGITDGYIIRADDETVNQSVLCSALCDYCEKDYTFVSGEEKRILSQREDVTSLEKWPASNCIAVIEDTVVIKLGAEGER